MGYWLEFGRGGRGMGLYCEMGELDGVVYGVCVNIATLVFCERCADTHTTRTILRPKYYPKKQTFHSTLLQ